MEVWTGWVASALLKTEVIPVYEAYASTTCSTTIHALWWSKIGTKQLKGTFLFVFLVFSNARNLGCTLIVGTDFWMRCRNLLYQVHNVVDHTEISQVCHGKLLIEIKIEIRRWLASIPHCLCHSLLKPFNPQNCII